MTPLEQLEALDTRLADLQRGFPTLQAGLAPLPMRQQLFGDLAQFWASTDANGRTQQQALRQLRHEQLLAQLELRLADQTLGNEHVFLLRTCLELPLSWQRQHLPGEQRAQAYRLLFSSASPNRRLYLPGAFVLIADGPQGSDAVPGEALGKAMMCSLSYGIETFDSLAELHNELCERIDDPLQSRPILNLLADPEDASLIQRADRLRYDWYADDMVEYQVSSMIDTQRKRLHRAWPQATAADDNMVSKALDLVGSMGSPPVLATRYALLLEKHMPGWMRSAPAQAITHILQTMQELGSAVERARAPGIPDIAQFSQRHTLLGWVRQRLAERLQRDLRVATAPQDIRISVTLARRIGPLLDPLNPSSYIAVASRPQVGDTIEMVPVSYQLDELALLNVAWFDVDYWLTARVQHVDGSLIDGLGPDQVKAMVRELDAGASYSQFVRKHLLQSAEARWRMEAHGRINRARMRAELAKARYARHLLQDPFERGYTWAKTVLDHPDSAQRASLEQHPFAVRQVVIEGHTLQGVLLINSSVAHIDSLMLYTPDAPDRRAWREWHNARALLREIRRNTPLRTYLKGRAPAASAARLEQLLVKGGLSPHLRLDSIEGNLFDACYRAEVHALIAEADASTRSNSELLGEFGLNTLRVILDLVSLVLPAPAMTALAFGRMAISIWDGLEAMHKDDREAALHHAIAAISHATDGINSFAGSAVIRRAMRGLPPTPPKPLPASHQVEAELARLRYRIDGVHDAKVYEQVNSGPGPDRYFIRDLQGRFYHVEFDGQRWRAVDPRQPNAYSQLPVKQLSSGEWVVDSPVLWHDGLPDLQALLDDCQLDPVREGEALAEEAGLFDADGELYLQLHNWQLPVRRHLLAGHYHLQLSEARAPAWAVLRLQQGQWRIRVRQPGLSSDWLALPQAGRG